MKSFEKQILIGAFLVLVGVFTPWHSFRFSFPGPGVLGGQLAEALTGTVMGYNLVHGLAVLGSSLLLAILALLPKAGTAVDRVRCGQIFLTGFILSLAVVGGVAPLSYPGVSPRLGLALVLLGSLVTAIGLWRWSPKPGGEAAGLSASY